MQKILIICGPTATGKTKIALDLALQFCGEIVSADSRQVYVGKDIITGKDIPSGFVKKDSGIKWQNQLLNYYSDGKIRIWLLDIVDQGEKFNVSFWRECAGLVISDIHSRRRLPVIVGGTGLYIKSLITPLSQISIPPNPKLRKRLEKLSPDRLFDYLNRFNPSKARQMNPSDRRNPRRLIRAIEISKYHQSPSPDVRRGDGGEVITRREVLQIGLTAPRVELYRRIDGRVNDRIRMGAVQEDPLLTADPVRWKFTEHALARRQITWFNKQPGIFWHDITDPRFYTAVQSRVRDWYNSLA